jgi:integrase
VGGFWFENVDSSESRSTGAKARGGVCAQARVGDARALGENHGVYQAGDETVNSMNQVFDRYEAECVPELGARTQRDYRRHLLTLRQHFGAFVPGTIKPKDVGRFLDVKTGKQHRNKVVAVLSSVMGFAVGAWYIDGCDVNPCQNVRRHECHPRTRYVTDDEFHAVRSLAPFSVQLAMDLALLTGQRQGDILDMTWLTVHETHIDVIQGKTGKHLGIRITPALEEVLLRARRYKPFIGPRLYIVRTRNGEPYTHEGFRALWQRVMDEAMRLGAIRTRYTFHDLRAKCATDKKDLAGASALLGHGDSRLTNRIYVRGMQMVDPLR